MRSSILLHGCCVQLLAAADPRGGVSLWRWPAALSTASSRRIRGHARAPAAVRFSHDDASLLSVGGDDLCLMQWRHLTDLGGDDVLGEDDSDVERDLKVTPPPPLLPSLRAVLLCVKALSRRFLEVCCIPVLELES